MITPREAARRIAEREASRLRQKKALRRQGEAVRAAFAAGHTIEIGRRIDMASFDPANSSPADAQKLIAQIAELLGVDDPANASHDEIDQALDTLFAAVTGGGTSNDGGGGDNGAPSEAGMTSPKIAANALTPQQRRICREKGITPAEFLAVKASFDGKHVARADRAAGRR